VYRRGADDLGFAYAGVLGAHLDNNGWNVLNQLAFEIGGPYTTPPKIRVVDSTLGPSSGAGLSINSGLCLVSNLTDNTAGLFLLSRAGTITKIAGDAAVVSGGSAGTNVIGTATGGGGNLFVYNYYASGNRRLLLIGIGFET
jgi:hypothetical protein